jgi:hypothetical protein
MRVSPAWDHNLLNYVGEQFDLSETTVCRRSAV